MPHAWPENPAHPDCRDDEIELDAAAARACCPPSTLRGAIARAELAVRREGRRVFVKIASLRLWIARRRNR